VAKDFGTVAALSGSAVCVDATQGLTLCGSVHGRRRQCSDGQANPSTFHMWKSSLTTLQKGSAFNHGSEYIKKKAGHDEDMLGLRRQVVPWACYRDWERP